MQPVCAVLDCVTFVLDFFLLCARASTTRQGGFSSTSVPQSAEGRLRLHLSLDTFSLSQLIHVLNTQMTNSAWDHLNLTTSNDGPHADTQSPSATSLSTFIQQGVAGGGIASICVLDT